MERDVYLIEFQGSGMDGWARVVGIIRIEMLVIRLKKKGEGGICRRVYALGI